MDDIVKSEPYEAPAITDIASVHELTLKGKKMRKVPDAIGGTHVKHMKTS